MIGHQRSAIIRAIDRLQFITPSPKAVSPLSILPWRRMHLALGQFPVQLPLSPVAAKLIDCGLGRGPNNLPRISVAHQREDDPPHPAHSHRAFAEPRPAPSLPRLYA